MSVGNVKLQISVSTLDSEGCVRRASTRGQTEQQTGIVMIVSEA